MKGCMKGMCTWIFMIFSIGVFAQATPHVVDYGNSAVKFKIKNAGIGVDGKFTDYSATMQFDPKNLTGSHVACKIKTTSISTGINGRDNHLRKEEFFYVDKYPVISFSSTAIKAQGSGYAVYGKLTIKDVTKDVIIPTTITKTGTTEVYEGNLTIDRLNYHVGEDSWVMSDEVMITIKITTK